MWRECMGIEPTQPDVVRSRDGFEDRESHQAPSTPVTVTQARDRASPRATTSPIAHGPRNERKILLDARSGDGDEQPARRLRID